MAQTADNKALTVFLCHGKEDKPAVRQLYERLTQDGFHPWLDEEDLLPGQDWEYEIKKAVRESDVVLVCLTRQSAATAGFRQKEIKMALDVADENPEGTIYVIPVKLEECDVPERLRRWHWVDYFDTNGHNKLMRALQVRATQIGLVSALAPPSIKINAVDGAEMIYIPAGEFIMGADDSRENEKPERKVFVDGYYIAKTPVTVAQYRKFCDKTRRAMPKEPSWGWDEQDYPIVNVSWEDAQAYCLWAGVSLPTEEEWEKSARGADGRKYPWGNEWDPSKCRKAGSDIKNPASVGSYLCGASSFGMLDMAGNVWEWCEDWYEKDAFRVVRGGGWLTDSVEYFRCTCRIRTQPASRIDDIGFRCVSRPGR